jgi:hypothetical protein
MVRKTCCGIGHNVKPGLPYRCRCGRANCVCALTPFAGARKGPPQLGRCFLWRAPQEDGNAGQCLLGIEGGKAQVGHTSATDAMHYRFRRDVRRRSNWYFNSRLTAGARNMLSILSRRH